MRQVAVNIRRARQAKGLSQESLARILDVSYSAVQGWESLTTQRSPWRSLPRLSQVLERPVDWFFIEHPDEDLAGSDDRRPARVAA